MMSEVSWKWCRFNTIFAICVLLCIVKADAFDLVKNVGGGMFDVDKEMISFTDCVWHVMCRLNEPLKIKKAADALVDQEIYYLIDNYKHYCSEDLQPYFTMEVLRSDEKWIELTPLFCSKEQEMKEDGRLSSLPIKYGAHSEEVCQDPELGEVCESMREAGIAYSDVLAEMTEKGECNVPAFKKKDETEK